MINAQEAKSMFRKDLAEAKDLKYIEKKIKRVARLRTQSTIYKRELQHPTLARFNLIQLGYTVKEEGYSYPTWEISWGDA